VKFFLATERDGPRNTDAATTATTAPTATTSMMTSIVLLKPGFFAGVDMSVVAWAKPPVLSVFPGAV